MIRKRRAAVATVAWEVAKTVAMIFLGIGADRVTTGIKVIER